MNTLNFNENQPIRNAQNFLRTISEYYPDVPNVVPDGVYGEQTTNSVRGFQSARGLPITGEIDNDTWKDIVVVFDEIMKYKQAPPRKAIGFPHQDRVIYPGETTYLLHMIQAMLFVLTQIFADLGTLEITGTHDENSVNVVKNIQRRAGHEMHGRIDKSTWDIIAGLYELFVTGIPEIDIQINF